MIVYSIGNVSFEIMILDSEPLALQCSVLGCILHTPFFFTYVLGVMIESIMKYDIIKLFMLDITLALFCLQCKRH